MKKNKSKSKSHSTSKKTRKELESKLAVAFNEVASPCGKSKKTDKLIEKFAKQLVKKVSISFKDDSMAPFIKEEPIEKVVKSKASTPKAKKEPVEKPLTDIVL